jgi:hypothetical protein
VTSLFQGKFHGEWVGEIKSLGQDCRSRAPLPIYQILGDLVGYRGRSTKLEELESMEER